MAKIDPARRAEIYDEKRNRTRATLVRAAMEVFSQKGLSGATTDDIIRAAGVSRGTLYNYFADIEEIIAAVATKLVDDMAGEIAGKFRPDTSAAEILAGTIAAYLCKAHADKSWGGVVAHFALKSAPNPVGAATAQGLQRILLQGLEEGVFHFRDARVANDLVKGASLYALKTVVDAPDSEGYIAEFLEGLLLALGMTQKRARNIAASVAKFTPRTVHLRAAT